MTRIELTQAVPPGVEARLYRAAFGRYVAVVRTGAGEYTAGGDTDHVALQRALHKAVREAR